MAASQFLKSEPATVTAVPSFVPSSCTVSIYKPDGSAIVTDATATVDSLSISITGQSASVPEKLSVSSTTDIVQGRPYLITSPDTGETSVCKASRATGTDLYLDQPPAFDVNSGDRVYGILCSYALTASQLSDLGMFYRAEFTVVPSSGDKVKLTQVFHVCRMQFQDPVTADDVKKVLAFQFPSAASRYQFQELVDIAQRASSMVMRQVEASGRYTQLIGDPSAFLDAGSFALRVVLADQNLIPQASTTDVVDYINSMTQRMREEVRTALKAGQWYDKNDDGVPDTAEKGAFSTRIRL